MAIVRTFGLDEKIAGLNLLAADVRPTCERLVKEGAEITARATKTAAEMHGLRRTGQLIESIGYGQVEVHSDSARVEVYPKGRREKYKATNATVGFVQDKGRRYGKKRRAGTGFFAEGQAASEDEVQALWEQGWSEFIDQRG